MANVLTEEPERRQRVDRRKNDDRRQLWRGEERRKVDRRHGFAAGLVIAASLAVPKPVQAQAFSGKRTSRNLTVATRQIESGANRITLAPAMLSTLKAPGTIKQRLGAEFDKLITEHAAAHGVRPELVRALIKQESNFNPQARSSRGAMGLMQLMPETAADMGVVDAFNPLQNIRGGVKYLKWLLNRYDNDETLALAAYNAGPGNVEKHGYKVPPFPETQQYVQRILGSLQASNVVTQTAANAAPVAAAKVIYKVVEVVNGQSIPRYSSTKPSSGEYQVLDVGLSAALAP